jgi:hypothetical protein
MILWPTATAAPLGDRHTDGRLEHVRGLIAQEHLVRARLTGVDLGHGW